MAGVTPMTASNSTTGHQEGSEQPPRVVLAGGGVGGTEALLALRALLGASVEIHLLAPSRRFTYQPLTVAAPFDLAEPYLFDLAELAHETSATLHLDLLAGVDAEQRRVQLAGGGLLDYDALLVAIGGRRREWLSGALHFAGSADVGAFQALLGRFDSGSEQRLVFVNPPGVSWTLPLYELVLLTASHLADAGVPGVELVVVTPEPSPLEVFGPAAGRLLRDLLGDRGVSLRTGADARQIEHGRLICDPDLVLEADHVVTLCKLDGPALPGLPCDEAGFIATDDHGRVEGLLDVYAVGDGTTFPVKQGGIAAQQADVAAEAIAAGMGAAVTPSTQAPTLRGMLLTGLAPMYIRTRLADHDADSTEIFGNPLWWPAGKISGRHLTRYLTGREVLRRRGAMQAPPAPEAGATAAPAGR